MKFISLCLLFVTLTQAAPWTKNIKSIFLTRSSSVLKPINSRIIGGNIAERHQFPYHVAVYLDNAGLCSGSLVSRTTVLTAAHCANNVFVYDVVLGAHNIDESDEPDRQVVRTFNGKLHPGFNLEYIDNDIAIVTMPIEVSGVGVEPIRLPSWSMASETYTGYVSRVTGWGQISDLFPIGSDELKYVDVTVITNALCTLTYGDLMDETKICVSTDGGSSGTCNGDSGGPLVIYESDGKPTVIGIVSFGSSDGCESGAPAVFTRITHHMTWIDNNSDVNIRP